MPRVFRMKVCVRLNSSSSRCVFLLRSSGRCCSSAVWCGSGMPTHCTNSMSVRELTHSELSHVFIFRFFFPVLKKSKRTNQTPRAFFRSFPQQGDALGRTSALAAGHLLQRPQPLLQIPNQRRGSGIRLQLPRLGVSPVDPPVPILSYAEACPGVLGWRGSTRTLKNFCLTRPSLGSLPASGTTRRPSRTSWTRYAIVRM